LDGCVGELEDLDLSEMVSNEWGEGMYTFSLLDDNCNLCWSVGLEGFVAHLIKDTERIGTSSRTSLSGDIRSWEEIAKRVYLILC